MKKILNVIAGAIVLGCIVCLTVSSGVLSSSSNSPSASFIAAALQDQVTTRGSSLEASYITQLRVGENIEGRRTRFNYKYVWTPNVVWVRKGYEASDDGVAWTMRNTKTTRYDVRTGTHKMLWAAADGKGISGRDVSGVPTDDWSTLDKMETACRYFCETPLYAAIKNGVVSEQQEEIDGHSCWKVDIILDASGGVEQHYFVWCDPEIGFCPRRLAMVFSNGDTYTVELTDYRDLGNGLWFPWKQDLKTTTSKGSSRCVSTLEDIHVGRTLPEEELAVTFPSGTLIEVGDPRSPGFAKVP